jgi:hypothetical protein
MTSEDLIDQLSADVPAVRRHALGWRLGLGLAVGALVSLLSLSLSLGLRPDLWLAMHGAMFWMKWGYTASLGICALAATAKLARPESRSLGWLWVALVPFAGLALMSVAELARAPSEQWLAMWLGASWKVCSTLVFIYALPIFAGLLWSFRRMAPTRLRAAGATAGLAAGAWSATVYCLHCPEVSAIFVLTWYTLGIALAALFGALVGPRLLRW